MKNRRRRIGQKSLNSCVKSCSMKSRKNLILKKVEFVLDMNFRMTSLNFFALFIWTYKHFIKIKKPVQTVMKLQICISNRFITIRIYCNRCCISSLGGVRMKRNVSGKKHFLNPGKQMLRRATTTFWWKNIDPSGMQSQPRSWCLQSPVYTCDYSLHMWLCYRDLRWMERTLDHWIVRTIKIGSVPNKVAI